MLTVAVPRLLRARGKRRLIVPGQAARAGRIGGNLAFDRAVVQRTQEEFLAGQVSPPVDGPGGPRSVLVATSRGLTGQLRPLDD